MDFLINKDKTMSKPHVTYVTSCNYKFNSVSLCDSFVIDTGAAKTVIPLTSLPPQTWENILILPTEKRRLCGIVGDPFTYRKIEVSDFEIAEGLVIPKLIIGVTDAQLKGCYLGFDVLSLFTLRYDASINNGLWHIASDKDAAGTITDIMKRSLNDSFDYIDPDFIAPITLDNFSAEDYLHEHLGSKINYIAPVTIKECKTEEDCLELIRQVNNVLGS